MDEFFSPWQNMLGMFQHNGIDIIISIEITNLLISFQTYYNFTVNLSQFCLVVEYFNALRV